MFYALIPIEQKLNLVSKLCTKTKYWNIKKKEYPKSKHSEHANHNKKRYVFSYFGNKRKYQP